MASALNSESDGEQDKRILRLYDDDIELMDILENNKFTDDECFPVHVEHFEWKETCKEILKNNLAE